MEMNICDDKKMVDIWLSNGEKMTRRSVSHFWISTTNTKRKIIWSRFLNPAARIYTRIPWICCAITGSALQSGKYSERKNSGQSVGNGNVPLKVS